MFFIYQSLSVISTQFNQANIRLPKKIDKLISYILVWTDMHKIYHHYRLPNTDANYGNIFSVWDIILETYMDLYREKIIKTAFSKLSNTHKILRNLK